MESAVLVSLIWTGVAVVVAETVWPLISHIRGRRRPVDGVRQRDLHRLRGKIGRAHV